MPNTPNINLDVRNFASSDPGWHTVQASNNQTYSYCYTGGDDQHGGLVQIVGQGRDTAPVQLTADPRYQIDQCVFVGDGQQQLSWSGGNRSGTITDANTQVETAKFTIIVTDTANGDCTIQCDPPIINQYGLGRSAAAAALRAPALSGPGRRR